METNNQNPESFDESQSLQVIKEMIQVSQKKLKNNGILFIIWGWIMFYTYISSYLSEIIITTYPIRQIVNYSRTVFSIAVVLYSLYYLVKQSRKVQTYIDISLRYVWISLIICLSMTNMIIFNVDHKINFELQHPVFMTFIAFATVITGGILRYRMVIFGGIVFGIFAYISSFYKLQEQILFEAISWFIAFVIPGHILYYKRNK